MYVKPLCIEEAFTTGEKLSKALAAPDCCDWQVWSLSTPLVNSEYLAAVRAAFDLAGTTPGHVWLRVPGTDAVELAAKEVPEAAANCWRALHELWSSCSGVQHYRCPRWLTHPAAAADAAEELAGKDAAEQRVDGLSSTAVVGMQVLVLSRNLLLWLLFLMWSLF